MKFKKTLASLLVGMIALTALAPLTACRGDDAAMPDIPDTPGDKDSWLYHDKEYDVYWYVDLSFFSYPNSGR
ncbi:MAG: hypothetical protein K2N18_05400, partial [Clostridia bacterium]|nr:hypothetical protein [Clostridia bacterium]